MSSTVCRRCGLPVEDGEEQGRPDPDPEGAGRMHYACARLDIQETNAARAAEQKGNIDEQAQNP